MRVMIPAIKPKTNGWTRFGLITSVTAQPIMELRELVVDRERYQQYLSWIARGRVTRKERC